MACEVGLRRLRSKQVDFAMVARDVSSQKVEEKVGRNGIPPYLTPVSPRLQLPGFHIWECYAENQLPGLSFTIAACSSRWSGCGSAGREGGEGGNGSGSDAAWWYQCTRQAQTHAANNQQADYPEYDTGSLSFRATHQYLLSVLSELHYSTAMRRHKPVLITTAWVSELTPKCRSPEGLLSFLKIRLNY